MDIQPYKHDFRALPSVPGMRQRPSCRVSDFLLDASVSDDTIFSLIGEATFQRKGEALTRTIQALISLRGKRRLSRRTIETLRAFRPLAPYINRTTIARLDAESRVVWRHNVLIRMIAGQRTVWETMRLLGIAPQPWEAEGVEPRIAAIYETAQAAWEADMPF